MPAMDTNGDSILFSVEEIVQYPLPGYIAPSSISCSHDDRLVSYLISSDGTLYCKIFAFDLVNRRQELIFSPPEGGGLDESNLSAEEKLRRERSRKRGLGVTRYECRATSPYIVGKPNIIVPLPSGVYFQNISGSKPEIRLRSSPESPIIDSHLSLDGTMIAYVRNDELYILDLPTGEPKKLTYGARESGKTYGLAKYIAQQCMSSIIWTSKKRWTEKRDSGGHLIVEILFSQNLIQLEYLLSELCIRVKVPLVQMHRKTIHTPLLEHLM